MQHVTNIEQGNMSGRDSTIEIAPGLLPSTPRKLDQCQMETGPGSHSIDGKKP